jgi:hypothetical protein
LRNLTHQQLNDNQQLLDLNPESNRADFRGFSKGLNQAGLSSRILKLNSFDSAHVKEVASKLIVAHGFWETRLTDKVASLFIQVLLKVRTDNNVHHSGLANLVKVKAARLVAFEHLRTQRGQKVHFFIRN